MKEEVTEVFVNSKDTMAVLDMNQFKGHAGGTFHGIFIATGRTETTMTAERPLFIEGKRYILMLHF